MQRTPTGFLIMQIGDDELDRVCAEVFVPALKASGLDPKRVDRHNRGELLKSEIIRFIEEAEIILADLTNERPNCYLEIGYAMGTGKFSNLILTCRDDHREGSPERKFDGPKIHFDLSGYDILFWQPSDLPAFRGQLERRIRQRLTMVAPSKGYDETEADQQWVQKHWLTARTGIESIGFDGCIEVGFSLLDDMPEKKSVELREAARSAAIRVKGSPFAVVLENAEGRPVPTTDGIVAELKSVGGPFGSSYSYWTIRRDGAFFSLNSLYEDRAETARNVIYYDTQIECIAEALVYCSRLYNCLGVTSRANVKIWIRHSGLKNRVLTHSSTRGKPVDGLKASEDEIETRHVLVLSEVENRLMEIVKLFAAPLFEMFEYQVVDDQVYFDRVEAIARQA